MAFKLTKQELNRRDELRDKLADARIDLDEAIAEQNRIIEDAYSAINAALDDYNEVVNEAYGFVEDIHAEREGEYDDKSERWQEGERGQAAYEWLDTLANERDELTGIDPLEAFTGVELDLTDHAAVIENLPEEASF